MRTLGRLLWLVISLILIIFSVVFAASNQTPVTLQLWPFETGLTLSIWLVFTSAFIMGGLLSGALIWGQWLAIRAKFWRLQGKFSELQAETGQNQDINN